MARFFYDWQGYVGNSGDYRLSNVAFNFLKTTFIYALKELKDGEYLSTKIRYIGKSDDPYHRFEEHCYTSGKLKNHLGNWIRGLPSRGLSLQLEVLDEVPEAEWEFWEKEYIRVFRAIGFNLVNGTDGGEGVTMTPEVRAKLSAAMRGRKRSLDHQSKISAAKRGQKHSPETRAKMSESQRRRKPPSEETRAKLSAAQRRRKPPSEETRIKISEALRGYKHSLESRARMSAAQKVRVSRGRSAIST